MRFKSLRTQGKILPFDILLLDFFLFHYKLYYSICYMFKHGTSYIKLYFQQNVLCRISNIFLNKTEFLNLYKSLFPEFNKILNSKVSVCFSWHVQIFGPKNKEIKQAYKFSRIACWGMCELPSFNTVEYLVLCKQLTYSKITHKHFLLSNASLRCLSLLSQRSIS